MNLGTVTGVGKAVVDVAKDKNVVDTGLNLLGKLFPYVGLRKKAVEVYVKEIEGSNLPPEIKAFTIFNTKTTFKKFKNQGKIAEIAVENAKEGTDFSEESKVDEEWFDRFMNAAGSVSSEEMQLIWGKILAKEFEEPGNTPRSITRILSEITPECARAFNKIANMKIFLAFLGENRKITSSTWRYIIPFNESKNYMQKLGLTFELMNELETLGLIKLDTIAGYSLVNEIMAKKILIYSNGKTLLLNDYKNTNIPLGNVMLTKAGEVLSSIIPVVNDKLYLEEIKKYMTGNGYAFQNTLKYQILVNGNQIKLNELTY